MERALATILTTIIATAMSIAQESRNTLNASASAWASVATNSKLHPLLSYSNEWGRYTQYDQGEGAVEASVAYAHTFRNPKLAFRAGVTGQLSSDRDRTQLSELYADFDLLMFDIRMGMENYTPVESNTATSVGSYIMSNNARPVPRGWVGILDYWSLPLDKLPLSFTSYLKDLVQIRGGISFGRIDDEGKAGYTDNILFHEKFAYGRVGTWFLKPYIGLCHSVVMGGTLSDGTKIPIDFMNSILGRHGDIKVFGQAFRGETTNAAGGHQGMWDCGFDFEVPETGISGKIYHQKLFTDAIARKFTSHMWDDFTLGLQIQLKRSVHVKDVSLEFVKTDWQGGEGLPDPYLPTRNGSMGLYWPGDVNEANAQYLRDNVFVEADVEEWESKIGKKIVDNDTFYAFCRDMYNRGLSYGGRMKYLYNYCIEQGWTRGGLSMGNALFHTKETVSRYAPEGTMTLDDTFANIRVRAVNIGVAGDILKERLSYNFRATISRNYGNYCEKYTGDHNLSWNELPNYFFATPKNETYAKLNLALALRHRLSVCTNFAYDFGELYHSFAFRAGVKYEIGKTF